MLDKGKDLDWFESNVIIALFLIALVAIAYFSIWNTYQKYPIVDFSFFKSRNFVVGTLCTTLGYLAFFGGTVTLPLWLQTQQGYNAFWAGVAIAPIGLVPFFLSPFVGKYMSSFDLRIIVALSFLFFSLSFFYQATFTTQVDLFTIMFTRFLQGFGVAIFFLPLVQLTLAGISKEKYASASGVFNFIRILVGSGFGTSLAIQLWTRLAIFHHARLGESVTSYNPLVTKFYQYLENHSPIYTSNITKNIIDKQVEQQAFMLATNDVAWLSGWLCLSLIPLIFLCKPVKPSAQLAKEVAH